MDDMQMEMVNIREQRMLREEYRQQIHEHLNDLQKWDLKEDQTIEQRRAAHTEMLIGRELNENEELRSRWMESKQSIHARKTAEGTPEQIQKPAKKTFKQKREDARLDEVAKKKTPLADHVSLHMVESLRSYQDSRDNSLALLPEDRLEQAEAQGLDLRPLHVFLHGYKRNAEGEPLNESEKVNRDQDLRFIDDYISFDPVRRKTHLDQMVDQVLKVNISDDMFTYEYLETHAGEMQEKINRMVCFQNVKDDPVNAGYFADLPDSTKQLLQHRVLDRYALYGTLLARICSLKAVHPDMGEIVPEIAGIEDEAALKEALKMTREFTKKEITKSRVEEHQMIEAEYARLSEAEKVRLTHVDEEERRGIEEKHQMTDQGADQSGLGLTSHGAVYGMKILANYRKLIEDHREEYGRYGQCMDALYQELYRSVDSYSDLKRREMIAKGVIAQLEVDIPYDCETKEVFSRRASIDADEAEASINVVQMQINAITEALTALAEDHPSMSEPARRMLESLGFQDNIR